MSLMRAAGVSMILAVAISLVSPAAAKGKKPKKGHSSKGGGKTEVTAEFDKQAASTAIVTADLQKCRVPSVPRGEGHVIITYEPSGVASFANVDRGPWLGTPTAKCLAEQFKKTKVPAFKGGPVTVGKVFRFD
jgi:hypothetical protein